MTVTVVSRSIRAAAGVAMLALVGGGLVAVSALPASADVPVPAETLIVSQTADAGAGPSALSLQTIDTTGTQTYEPVPLPSTGPTAFTMGGASDAGGYLSTATDGSGVALGGFAVAVGGSLTTDPKDATVAQAPRAAGFVANDGTFTQYSLGTTMSGGVRSVATVNGTDLYAAGNDGKTGATFSGIRLVNSTDDGSPVKISGNGNYRTVGIVDGQLYGTTDKDTAGFVKIGTDVPTSQGTDTNLVPIASGTPNGFVVLTDGTTTVLYVLVEGSGIEKFTQAHDSSTWTAAGTIPSTTAGTDRGLAGEWVPGVGAVLYTLDSAKTAGNHVLRFVDSTATQDASNVGAATTVATAAAGTVFHGLTVAPADWDATVAPKPLVVTAATPALPTEVGSGGGTVSTSVTVSGDGDPVDATVTANITSGSGTALTDATVVDDGDGDYTVTATRGTGVGTSVVTISASHAGFGDSSATFVVAQSAAPDALSDASFLDGAADASTAIDVGTTGGHRYAIVADDEDATLRLYDTTAGGAPSDEWDLVSMAGLSSANEPDFEASARVGDTVYWFGSESDNKSSEVQPDRDLIVKTTIVADGAGTTLVWDGTYTGVRDRIVDWADGDGADPALAADCATTGAQNYPDDSDGCNIEGAEFAPGSSTTVYLALRAPVEDGKAVIVPITNLPSLFGPDATDPTFGSIARIDLGGRGIRELRANAAGQYLLTAGSPDDEGIAPDFALYRWDGVTADAPVQLTALPSFMDSSHTLEAGSWETIVTMPADLGATGARVQLAADNGTTPFYGDDIAGKDIAPQALQKDVASWFSTEGTQLTAGTVSITGATQFGSTLSAIPAGWAGGVTFAYQWLTNGVAIPGATGASLVLGTAQLGARISVTATASSTGHRSTSATSTETVAVTTATLASTAPTISGKAKVGSTLTAAVGSWQPGASLAYQWSANGAAISGATGSSLKLAVSLAGKRVTVTVTGTLAGYGTTSLSSAATASVAKGTIAKSPKPKISGAVRVGKKLTVKPGTWSPGVKLAYTWYANGKAIKGQHKKTLKLASSQRGRKITIKVTGKRSGYASHSVTSSKTKSVR